jgi:hypothetical protein
MAIGTRHNPRALTPILTSPDPLAVASPAPSPPSLSDLAGMAENTTPNFPHLGSVIHPSDKREDDDAHALLSPVHLSRGRVRNCSASSPGSPAPPASKKPRAKSTTLHPEFHGFQPASPLPSSSALPSPAPLGLTLRIPGGRSPGRSSSLPPATLKDLQLSWGCSWYKCWREEIWVRYVRPLGEAEKANIHWWQL